MTIKILIADPISESGLDVFQSQNGHFKLDARSKLSLEDLKKAVVDVDAIIVRSETKITSDILAAGKKIKIVGRAGVGVDNIDVAAASRQGVLVVNVPGGNTISAAEHTVALLLSLSRNIPSANDSIKKGEWNRSKFTGSELHGKTLGLIGLGRIGREVAKRCQSFGMRVLGYDPFASEDYAKACNITLEPLETLYKESDYLTVHVPLNETTKHMLNAKTILQLKPGVRIINCARGGIIDEKALAGAIESGHVKGAALDVFEEEPPAKDNPLLKLPQVIATPHLGAATEEAQVKVAQELAETIRDYFMTGTVRNAVNLPAMGAEEYRELEPYILLAEKLGKFITQLFEGAVKELRITYAGDISQKNTTPLTLAALKGFLDPILDLEVNLINAPHLARERGLKWVETKTSQAEDFTSLITLRAISGQKKLSIAGTLLAKNSPRIVMIDELSVDVVPEGTMVVYTNLDRPGMIGFIGTLLGKHKINIAAMQVGRKASGGDAVTVVNVDSHVPKEILQQIREFPGITQVRCVKL
ncbi:MAG: phosphoglycerate dehydrogenase [Elusimicrobia bacterium RIFCSPLOWO2_01_FULL_59_12]|nr:MAG: phosphoglycerate dehydrogenase [Elusimicrobia bacterium RIFCSPLOWO2_01_FULL_59_12]